MRIDGIQLGQNSNISNLTVVSGGAFPAGPVTGELFFHTSATSALHGLYIYVNGTWTRISTEQQLVSPAGTTLPTGSTAAGQLFFLNTTDATEGLYFYDVINGWKPVASGSQPATLITGDVTGTINQGAASALTLATVGTAGTYRSVTVNAKGLVLSGSNPTTLVGYGITDAQALSADLTAISALTGTGLARRSAPGTWALDSAAFITGNQTITVSGDAVGSGTTSIPLTLASVNANVGTFGSAGAYPIITVNVKGLVTAVSTAALSTSNIAEGTNLYFTAARAQGAISVSGTGLSYAAGVITLNATSVNTALTVVARDASGNFSAGTITGNFIGNASTSTVLQVPRSISATGDAAWTVNFDGSANVTAPLTLSAVNTNIGTFAAHTVNAKGLVTAASNLSGDGSSAGSTFTLSTVNANIGTFGSAGAVPTIIVNAKGLVTAAGSTPISIDASQVMTGTFASSRISQASVTQYQAALSIQETQIPVGALLARLGVNQTVTGSWSFNNPVSAVDPVSASQLATKQYVDNLTTGLNTKASVRVASTANLTFTGTQVIDGVAAVAGDRVLVKDQSTGSQNGIYVVAVGAWARSSDATTNAEVQSGLYVFVSEGTANANSGWLLSTPNPILLNSTSLLFVQFTGLGQVVAGAGLTKTGNTIDVNTASAARIVVNADTIDLAAAGTAGTYKSVSTDSYGRVTSGTNPTTLAGYGITDAQGALGYTPVQQGTGIGQGSNTVKIGWNVSRLKLTVDVTDLGNFAMETSANVFSAVQTITTNGSGGSLVISDVGVNGANIRLSGSGATTPAKSIRAQGGALEFLNNSYANVILSLTDSGALLAATSVSAPLIAAAGSSYPLTVNSTSSNPEKIALLDNGTVRGYIGGTSLLPFFVTNAAVTQRVITVDQTGNVIAAGGGTFSGQLTINAAALPITVNSASSLKISFGDTGTARGYIASTAAYCFAAINSANTIYALSVDNAGNTVAAGTLTSQGVLYAPAFSTADFVRIPVPPGAARISLAASETGALKIKLPVSYNSCMMRMKIRIYEYNQDASFDIELGGYNYSTNSTWINTFAYMQRSTSAKRPTVRFGNDGTTNCIWIGDLTSVWTYPQIEVTDLFCGYAGVSQAFLGAWAITLVTAFDTVNATVAPANDATTVNGASASVGVAGSTIVQRDASGYLYGNYVNMTDNSQPSGVSALICKAGDNYYRSATAAAVKAFLALAADTTVWTGINYFLGNKGATSTLGTNVSYGLEAYATDGGAAAMSFHRSGAFAVNMGLDPDNVFRIGGWSAAANRLQMDMSGNLTMAGDITAFSDERLKQNWRELPTAFVDLWAQVKHGIYDRVDSGKTQIGLSAQSVQQVLPNAVTLNADGYLSLNYGSAAAVATVELAQAVIELRQENATQRELIASLIKRLEALETK